MKREMNNWREFISLEEQKVTQGVISFYKNPPTTEYLTEVLGIKVPLNESYTSYSQTLVEEIVREQLLFEGFWDNIKEKTKEHGTAIVDLFSVLKGVFKSPAALRRYRRMTVEFTNNAIDKIIEVMNKAILKIPSTSTIIQKILGVFTNLREKLNSTPGWKGAMANSAFFVIFAYLQRKFRNLFLEKSGTGEDLEKGLNLFYQFAVEKFNLESVATKVLNKMIDIKSYLSFLGPIVGGVQFIAMSLRDITSKFIKDYGALIARGDTQRDRDTPDPQDWTPEFASKFKD